MNAKKIPLAILGSAAGFFTVTSGGNTAHSTVTMQMMIMKGITPLYTSWIFTSPGRIPLT